MYVCMYVCEIWRLYIVGCLELVNGKCSNKQKDKRIRKLLDVFEQAYNKNKTYLTPKLYVQWLDVLTNLGLIDRALQVTELATTQYPKSLLLWKHKLDIMVRGSASDSDVIQVFKESLKHIAEKKGLMSGPDVSCPVKEFYLQWTYLNSDIHQARNLYKRLIQMKPVTKQFYQYYIAMEMAQPKSKTKLLRRTFEDVVTEFGFKDADIWIDYIKFELNSPKGKPEEIGNIHFRAVKCLNGELNQRFIAQYTLLQTGIGQS
ncbi:hypothetical protein KUTeg_004007 [Tegillarca granosa]|uniref:U3 small nucleolar RNA-associated protein 6 homolog C-terminal domain-containing protein n=1 Tax=Tegillarca granosa TaxID=220873 RepID=A0ABQ9FQD4_TEGGR|nr:hypothetical protein KUTeg_004007 [Tegillarca granosa]